jgi:hypothetical protein
MRLPNPPRGAIVRAIESGMVGNGMGMGRIAVVFMLQDLQSGGEGG